MTIGQSPPRIFDRELRRRRSARSASSFSRHDFLHAHAAMLAAEKLADVSRNFGRACIWGDRSRQLLPCLTDGKIGDVYYADILPGLGRAVAADVEQSPFAESMFDLVVSLLDLHAANDPIGALIQIRRSLKPDGLFIGVMFGAETLNELRTALGQAEIDLEGGLSPRVFPFADVRDAGSLLQRAGLALPVADIDRLTVEYASPMRLLEDLRGAGETNILNGRRKRFIRRSFIERALDAYEVRQVMGQAKFPATFTFISMTGWAPHHTQQTPLQPGTAKVRLVDIFGLPGAE